MKFPNHFALALLLLFLAIPLASAHEGDNEAFNESSGGLGIVHIDEQGRRAIGLVLQKPDRRPLETILKATGEVQAAETQSVHVTAPVPGVVKEVLAKQGDNVRRGQRLAVVHSIDVANALTEVLNEQTRLQGEISKLNADYNSEIQVQQKEIQLAKQNFEREEKLLEEGLSARKNYLDTKNNFEKAQVKLSALLERKRQDLGAKEKQKKVLAQNATGQLNVMGLSTLTIKSALRTGTVIADLDILSPASGTVVTRNVTLGERVDSSKTIFSVVNLSPIWINIDIFQEQSRLVRVGQTVRLTTPTQQIVTGDISSVGTIIDSEKKTLHVRVVSTNNPRVLTPGMFVTAEVITATASGGNLSVPPAAIVYHQELPYVFVQEDDHFEPVKVVLGSQNAARVEVLSGIPDGSNVVVSGAQQLRAQALVGGAGHGHHEEGGHEEEEGASHEGKAVNTAPEEHEPAGGDEHGHGQTSNKTAVNSLMIYFAGLLTMLAIVLSWNFVKAASRKRLAKTRQIETRTTDPDIAAKGT